MNLKDVNGQLLARGDYVVIADANQLDDPVNNYGIGVGQIEHIFTEGRRAGIYVRFAKSVRIANMGLALRKVSLSERTLYEQSTTQG